MDLITRVLGDAPAFLSNAVEHRDRLGIESVAVHSRHDSDLLYVSQATLSHCIGDESYLNAELMVELAQQW